MTPKESKKPLNLTKEESYKFKSITLLDNICRFCKGKGFYDIKVRDFEGCADFKQVDCDFCKNK